MRIEKCSFCSCPVYPGHGQMFVRNDCKTFRFCRSKCKKNFGLKRNPLRVKWTKTYRMARNKELTVDKTLDFEAKRNVPVRYNRNTTAATVEAMKRIADIKEQRMAAHWRNRMDEKRETIDRQDIRNLERNMTLLKDNAELHKHAEEVVAASKREKETKAQERRQDMKVDAVQEKSKRKISREEKKRFASKELA